jgi:hypothetical protein
LKLGMLPQPETSPPSRSVLVPPRIWDVLDSYDKNLQSKFIRAFRFISRDIRHPSLRLELVKMPQSSFFRARVDPKFRIHFELKDGYYLIVAVGSHRLQGIG